jgi:hypothetical protein
MHWFARHSRESPPACPNIDLLAEAYAEEQWMVYRLTAQEIREIADRDGTDPEAGEEAVKEHWERAADLPDTRLPAKDRALLGARAEAFATPEVRRRFNALGACYPPLIARGQAPALKIKAGLALDALRTQVRAEVGVSEETNR